jgi:plastocyanin domain-containing protein
VKPIALAALLGMFVTVLVGCRTGGQAAKGPLEFQLAVTDRGFEPALTVIPRGHAVTLVVTRKTDQTCAKDIVIPKLSERRELPLNRAVRIEIPAQADADTLNYACGMNMVAGAVVAK